MFSGLGWLLLVIGAFVLLGVWESRNRRSGPASYRHVTSPATREDFCPRCGSPLAGGECLICAWPLAARGSDAELALRALGDHLDALRRAGMLPKEVDARLATAIRQELALVRPSEPVIDESMIEVVVVDEAPPPLPRKPPVVAPAPLFVAERAEKYALARKSAVEEPPKPVAAPVPKARLADLLAAFMEEKNVRWGELVGGLLIVGCSIALVISFWTQITARPTLKFSLFNGIPAAFLAAGFYMQARWKLPTASRGALAIGTLLVPLNFLAIAAFTKDAALMNQPLVVAGEVISLAVFAGLVYRAGRWIASLAPLGLAVGVLGPSIATLLVRRFVDAQAPLTMLWLLAGGALTCHAVAVGWGLVRLRRVAELDEPHVNDLFRLLGLTAFAIAPVGGLLVYMSGETALVLRQIAPLVALAGGPALAAGLMLWQRLQNRELAGLRTAGTAIAVIAAGVMFAGLALAWPEPAQVTAVATAIFAVMTVVALAYELPAAHLLAGAAGSLGALVVLHVARGALAWDSLDPSALLRALLSATSGGFLGLLSAAYGAAAVGWLNVRRRGDAACYAIVAAAASVACVALVSWYGLGIEGDPQGATWIYAAYAAVALVAAGGVARYDTSLPAIVGRIRLAEGLALAGAVLTAVGLAQGLVYRWGDSLALAAPWTTVAAVEALLMAAVAFGHRLYVRRSHAAHEWLLNCALAASAVAAALVGLDAGRASVPWLACAIHVAALAQVWLAAAAWRRSPELLAVFQAGGFAAVALAGVEFASRESWYAGAAWPWLDPRFVVLQGQLAALLCLAWVAVRVGLARFAATRAPLAGARDLVQAQRPGVDHVVTAVVLTALVAVAGYAAWPGVAQELAPRLSVLDIQSQAPQLVTGEGQRLVPATAAFELAGIPHAQAGGAATWALWILILAVLVAGFWEQFNAWRVLGVLALLAAVCPLVAARWEGDVSTASALRWLAGIYFLGGSLLIWSRDAIARFGARIGWRELGDQVTVSPAGALAAVVALTVLPLASMGAYIAVAALAHASAPPGFNELYFQLAIVGGVAVVIAAGLALVGRRGASANDARPSGSSWAGSAAALILILGVAPLVVMSTSVVATALAGNPVVGPSPGSLFARMGLAVNYSVPAALAALVLVGHAIRERAGGFAFAAALVSLLSATMAFLFTVGAKLSVRDPALWVDLAQLNALVAATFGLAWIGAVAWARRRAGAADEQRADPLLAVLAAMAGALNLLVLAPAAFSMVWDPKALPGWLPTAGDIVGVIAAVATFAFALGVVGRGAALAWTALTAAGLWAAASIVGIAAGRWDASNYLALHTLLAARTAAAALLLAGAWAWWRRAELTLADPRRRAVSLWTSLLAIPPAAIALRMLPLKDPQEPWWSTGAWLALAVVAVAMAMWSCRRRYVYIAATLATWAAACWYPRWVSSGSASFIEWVDVVVTAAMLPVVGWVAIELRWIRPRRDAQMPSRIALGAYRPLTWCAIGVLGLVTFAGIVDDFGTSTSTVDHTWLGWLALAATLVAAMANLWDRRAREAVALLYAFGLLLVGVYIDRLNLDGALLVSAGAMALGAFTLLSTYLWSRQETLRAFASQTLGLEARGDSPTGGLAWMAPITALLVATVTYLSYWTLLVNDSWSMRIAAGQAVLSQTLALGLLAHDGLRRRLQAAALTLGVLGLVACGWSFVAPGSAGGVLARNVATCVALVVAAIVYGLLFTKLPARWSDWTTAAARFTPVVVVALVASVVAVLAQETWQYLDTGVVALAAPGIVAVAIALLLLFGAALAAALLPGRDPLGLPERGRMAYVYAAEAILALLFLHIRVTWPELFSGRFRMYWPLIVMAIAYLGVGLGEFFARRRQRVLAEPLERTGILLPLLPVLGFWFIGSETNYSVLLLVVGAIYAALAVTRKSFGFGLLAALAANGGLWHFLSRLDGLGLVEHPQLWLIPPALCVLAAAYLNRDRLEAAQMTAIRYITSLTIYLSSTADIFINGVAEAPWLPLVLAGLAIAGVAAGIALRVRAFLYLGTSFLVLAILTIIWHTAVDLGQRWIWAASGIVLGVAILVVFAIFEKKRQEVLGLVERMKHWQP